MAKCQFKDPQTGEECGQSDAEAVFAGLFAVSALYIMVNEGRENWQSLWTCAAYFLLGVTLWQARYVAVVKLVDQPAGLRLEEVEAPEMV